MGDRCYARITVRKQDQEAWEALGYDDCDGESGENFIELVDYERNYGVTEWGDDLAVGCPMFGYHDEGGEYAAQVFAYDGETFLSHECNHNRMPVVEADLMDHAKRILI